MTRLLLVLLRNVGPFVPVWELHEAWAVAREWHEEALRHERDAVWAMEANAALIEQLTIAQHELTNLKKAGD